MWVEFTWGNSNAFPRFIFCMSLKKLNFGSTIDDNRYKEEGDRRQTEWEFSHNLKILWLFSIL